MTVAGITIFGPGSEWLWTMAQFLALTVTGLAIFRQLRAQAWANQFAIFSSYGDDFNSEQMTRFKLRLLQEVTEGSRRVSPAAARVGEFFNNAGEGQRLGHLRPAFAWQNWSEVSQTYWALLEPIAVAGRVRQPDLWKDWEAWVAQLRERDRKAGRTVNLSPEYLAWWVPDAMEYYVARLEIEQETRKRDAPTLPPTPGASTSEDDRE